MTVPNKQIYRATIYMKSGNSIVQDFTELQADLPTFIKWKCHGDLNNGKNRLLDISVSDIEAITYQIIELTDDNS